MERTHPAGQGHSHRGQSQALPCSKGGRMRPLVLPRSRRGSAGFSLSDLPATSHPAHPMGFWMIQPHFQPVIRVHGCEQHQPAGAERQHFPHHSELFPSINGPPRPTGRVIGSCSAAGRPNRPLDPSVSAKSGYEDPRGRATEATAASLRDLCRQRGERTDSAPCNRPPAEPQRAGKALNPPRGPGGLSPAHSASSWGSFPLPEPP